MPGGKSPGPSIKYPRMYEGLRKHGMAKSKAAAISNAFAGEHPRHSGVKRAGKKK